MTEKVGTKKSASKKVLQKLMQFHLPIILVLAIIIGIVFPAPGVFLSETIFTKFCVFMIFIISGLRLDISSVKEAMKYWAVGVLLLVHHSILSLELSLF